MTTFTEQTTIRPLGSSALNSYLSIAVEQVLRGILKRATPGQCLRVDELPPAVIEQVATRLFDDPPADTAIAVLYDDEDYPVRATGYAVSIGRAVELRNDLTRALVVFVPPDLRAGAVDSLGANTFVVVKEVRRDQLFMQVRLTLEQDMRIMGLVDAVLVVKVAEDMLADRLGKDDILNYYLTIQANAGVNGVIGGALYCLGLFPDFGMPKDDYNGRLKQNKEACDILLTRTERLLTRVHKLKVRDEAIYAKMYELLNASDWRRALERIATEAEYRSLALEQWLPKRTDEVYPTLFIAPLRSLKSRPNEQALEFNIPLGKKAKFRVSWTSEPVPGDCPNVAYYRLELLDAVDTVVWTGRNKNKGKISRQSAEVELEDGELPANLYHVRVRAYDQNGNRVNEERRLESRRDPNNEESRHVNESEDFWLGQQAPDLDSPQAINRKVGSLGEAALLAAGSSVKDAPVEQREFDVKGEPGAGNVIDVRFGEGAKFTYSIELNPHLTLLERQILANPQQASGWAIIVAGDKCDVMSPNSTQLPVPLAEARKALFSAIAQAAAEGQGGGVFAATDLALLPDKLIDNYIDAYLQWLSSSLAQIDKAEVADYDIVTVWLGDEVRARLMAPSHPLLLLWQIRHARLQRHWLEQRRKEKNPLVREEMDKFLSSLIPRNLPMLLKQGQGWLLQCEVLSGGWSLYLPVERAARRATARQLASLGVSVPADTSPSDLARMLHSYLNQHPYVSTLKINVFGEGTGDWLASTLVSLQQAGQDNENQLLTDLRYDIRLFNSDRDDIRESGSALTALLNPERQVSEYAAMFAEPSGNSLYPKLRLSRHNRSDFLAHPSRFEAHVALLLEPFPVEAGFGDLLPFGRSSYVAGLVQEPISTYDNEGGNFSWHRQLMINGASKDTLSRALNLFTVLQGSHEANGTMEQRPTLSLELDADSRNLIYQVHDACDWVMTLDPNIGLEYFDEVSDEPRPIYLLAYTPPYIGNNESRLLLTTRAVDEVTTVLRRMLNKLGVDHDPRTAPLFLDLLRSLSGELALRLLASQRSAEEMVGLVLTRLYLEQHDLLKQRLLIPLDAHLDMFNPREEGDAKLRGDLLLIEPDAARRRLVMHVVETKYRSTMPTGLAHRELEQHIISQLANTRNRLNSRFDFDEERVDLTLRVRELTVLLEFYLERARRYRLVDDEFAARVRPFIYSLDDGYKLEFRYSGFIFCPGTYSDLSSTVEGMAMITLGERTIQESLDTAMGAVDGVVGRLKAVGGAEEIVEHFTTGRIPHLRANNGVNHSVRIVSNDEEETGFHAPRNLNPPTIDELFSTLGKQSESGSEDEGTKLPMIDTIEQLEESSHVVATPTGTRVEEEARGQSIPIARMNEQAQDEENTIQVSPALREELAELAHDFIRAARHYKINVQDCNPAQSVVGPSVMRLYVRLAKGQPLAPLRGALEDIGREMKHERLLVSVIPGSDAVALDVPRKSRQIVPFSSGLKRLPMISSLEQMPLTIGVTPEGQHIIKDLADMPHMLVGGTTGAGKTIFLYTLLCSLLYTHRNPADLKLFISTSKSEDFTFFDKLPHLEGGAVISDAQEAVDMISEVVVVEFERRRRLLEESGVRDITEYNLTSSTPLAPFVVVVDEFADLADQLAGQKKVRDAFYIVIRRIAQLGRNRGMHLILCTQRPSVDLVPSAIRTLMNTRVALRMNDGIASKMILDEGGAELLQKHGDLLFKEDDITTRVQGYYVSSSELRDFLALLKR